MKKSELRCFISHHEKSCMDFRRVFRIISDNLKEEKVLNIPTTDDDEIKVEKRTRNRAREVKLQRSQTFAASDVTKVSQASTTSEQKSMCRKRFLHYILFNSINDTICRI